MTALFIAAGSVSVPPASLLENRASARMSAGCYSTVADATERLGDTLPGIEMPG